MKITITEKGSESFYKEVLNISAQYRKLLRKPNSKLEDQFNTWKVLFISSVILFILYVIEICIWGKTSTLEIMMVSVISLAILSGTSLKQLNKKLEAMLNDEGDSIFTIDEEGIELNKTSVSAKLSWQNIAFVRTFKESTCFLPKNKTDKIIAISNKYLEEIKPYIKTQIY